MSDHLFPEAVMFIKAGDIDKGQRLLMRIVRDNPQNEKAWLWLVNTTPKQANQIGCLEKVLQINPDHQTAKKLIAELKDAQAKEAAEAAKAAESKLAFEYIAVPANGNGIYNNGKIAHTNGVNGSAPATQPFDIFQDPAEKKIEEIASQPGEVLQDPLMVKIEKEQAIIEEAAKKEAAKKEAAEKAVQLEQAQRVAQEEAAKKVAAIAQAALEQAALDKNGLDINKFDQTDGDEQADDVADSVKNKKLEIKIPEAVYEFPVAIVDSKKGGALGFLFKAKEQLAKGTIKIAPEVGILQIKRVDSLVQGEQYNLYFHDIKMIECPEPGVLTFTLQSGKEIQLKEATKFNDIVKLLSPYITVRAKEHFIQTPPHFEQRVSQLV